jgi:hypothetical protein
VSGVKKTKIRGKKNGALFHTIKVQNKASLTFPRVCIASSRASSPSCNDSLLSAEDLVQLGLVALNFSRLARIFVWLDRIFSWFPRT